MIGRRETPATAAILSFQVNTDIIGAKCIHAYLLAHDIASHLILIPFPCRSANDAVVTFLKERHIRVVGMSIMTPESLFAFSCADRIKAAIPDVLVVYGGIHATVDPKSCLRHGDAAVRGEGEIAFLDILKKVACGEAIAGSPGTCSEKNGQYIENPPSPLMNDLDVLPFPRHLPSEMYVVRHGVVRSMARRLFSKYGRYGGRFLTITTTRGCPFACAYCCNSAYRMLYPQWGIRSRSVSSVIEELMCEVAAHPDLITINIQDDCFLAKSREWLADFAEQYKARVGIPFIIRTTPAHIRRDVLARLKQAGLTLIMLGLQSGSNRINRDVYHRPVTQAQFLAATRVIHEVGVSVVYDVLVDNPYETEADILETLEVVLSIPRPFQLQIFGLRFFKGTELQQRSVRDGISGVDPRVNLIIASPTTLNRLIRMAPVYPQSVVRWLTVHRHGRFCRGIIRTLSLVSDTVLTPFSYLYFIHKAYGSKITTTAPLFVCLAKTFMQERVLPKHRKAA